MSTSDIDLCILAIPQWLLDNWGSRDDLTDTTWGDFIRLFLTKGCLRSEPELYLFMVCCCREYWRVRTVSLLFGCTLENSWLIISSPTLMLQISMASFRVRNCSHFLSSVNVVCAFPKRILFPLNSSYALIWSTLPSSFLNGMTWRVNKMDFSHMLSV